jgi:aminopeptidase N
VREPWLDESLATYSALISLEVTQGPEAGERLAAQWLDSDGPRGPGDPPVNVSTLAFSTWGPYHATVYTRGALFLDELRGELGDKYFFALLRRYQGEHRYRVATTGDFLSLAEEAAGRDLDPLFASWFDTDAVQIEGGSNAALSSPPLRESQLSPNPRYPSRKGGPVE